MIKDVNIVTRQSAREAIQISSTKHSHLCVVELCFMCRAHSTSLIMALLHSYSCSKLADCFSRTLFFGIKLSKIQENVKFKYFSRSMDSFQGLFKTNFVFKDFSRLPFIFKYFSSLCKPCQGVVKFKHCYEILNPCPPKPKETN